MRLMDVMCGIGTFTVGACVGGFLAFLFLASGSASVCIRIIGQDSLEDQYTFTLLSVSYTSI